MKDRKWDIKYVKKHFPKSTFKMFEGIGHGGLAALKLKLMTSEIKITIKKNTWVTERK